MNFALQSFCRSHISQAWSYRAKYPLIEYHGVVTAMACVAVLAVSGPCFAAAPVIIGNTSRTLDGSGCAYFISDTDKPVLAKSLSEDGLHGFYYYAHTADKPSLVIGAFASTSNTRPLAALNLNGNELLLTQVAQKPIQCLDEAHHKLTQCSAEQYAGRDIKMSVKRLTGQSACIPDNSSCAGDVATVRVAIESAATTQAVVMVGGCSE